MHYPKIFFPKFSVSYGSFHYLILTIGIVTRDQFIRGLTLIHPMLTAGEIAMVADHCSIEGKPFIGSSSLFCYFKNRKSYKISNRMVYFELEYLVPFQEMLTPASVNAFIFECNQMFDLI